MYRLDKRPRLLSLACMAILVAAPTLALTQAGDSTASQNSAPGAIPAAQPSQATLPKRQPSPEELGDSYMLHKRYQAAIQAYSQASPKSATLWNKLGIANQMMLNPVEAIRCYHAALKIEPHNSKVINNLGTVYDSEKQYGDAQKMYRNALKHDPQSALIRKNLGTVLMAQHKYKEGWKMYESALAIDPGIFDNTNALKVNNPTSVEDRGAMNYYMARGCARVGLNQRAIDYLRKALNEGFTNPKKIAEDSDFARLRGIPEFEQLIASEKAQ